MPVCECQFLCQFERVYDHVCSPFHDGAGLSSVVKLNGVGVNCLNKTGIYWTMEAIFYFLFQRGKITHISEICIQERVIEHLGHA